jgi:hypothetical protein
MRDTGPAAGPVAAPPGTGGGLLPADRCRCAGHRAGRGRAAPGRSRLAVTFLGVATLSPWWPGRWRPPWPCRSPGGVPGRLGRANAVRNPRRTSATAAALMVGLALVSAVAVPRCLPKESGSAVVERSFAADFVLTSSSSRASRRRSWTGCERRRSWCGTGGAHGSAAGGRWSDWRRHSPRRGGRAGRVEGRIVEGDLASLDDGRLRRQHRRRPRSWTCPSATPSRPRGPRPGRRDGARGGVRTQRVPDAARRL